MAGEIDLSQFHDVFFEESFEGLDAMESGLLALDIANPDQEIINTVFRAAHSIKGGSGTFGFLDIADFTHVMESMLDDVRSHEVEMTDPLIQLLLESVDFLKHMLSECKADRSVAESDAIAFVERLSSFKELQNSAADTESTNKKSKSGSRKTKEKSKATKATKATKAIKTTKAVKRTSKAKTKSPAASEKTIETIIEEEPDNSFNSLRNWKITLKPDLDLFHSGIDPYPLIRELSTLGDLKSEIDISQLPEFHQLEPENCYLSWDLTLINSESDEETISEIFEWIEGDTQISAIEADKEEEPAQSAPEQVSKTDKGSVKTDTTYSSPEVSSIRVNIDRVDMLVNLVGELVITQSMLSRFKDGVRSNELAEFARGIEQLEENTRELQERTMQIRMLPIDNVFQRLPRLVRDLSKSLQKEVQLTINGKSTEVDRTVLEKISDPLTHLVRNCMDHGIESPELRIINGKPPVGQVEVSAFHEGGNIIIEVQDDGNGLDLDAIRAKAVEKNLINPDTDYSDSQIEQLIFTPGFSTTQQVSDVSGRGVGMDVVKNNIDQINGHIDVRSRQGKGSCFSIKLPLTLAIIEGQLVRIGTDVLIIPLLSIVKSTRISSADYNMVAGESGMYRLDEDYIPVVPLKEVYDIRSDYDDVFGAILVIVDAVDRFGILVDEVLGQQQVVVKSLETNFKQVPTISGATILGDGTVAMILDVGSLLKIFRSTTQTRLATHE